MIVLYSIHQTKNIPISWLKDHNFSSQEKTLKDRFPYDPEKQEAVLRCSVCTGEKIAGFKNKADGHFTEVMVIRSPEEQRFKDTCGINELKKEY